MNYKEILRTIAEKEGVSPKQVEKEMITALKIVGIDTSVKEFIKTTSSGIINRLYIV